LRIQGHLPEALNSYRECVGLGENLVGKSISRKLAAQDPNNAEWQRDLSISLERVGIILSAESNFAEALDKEVESLAIRKKLASREESNAQWQNDLSWSYISVGDLLYAKKDVEGALINYRTAQGLERELVKRDASALELQSDLAVTVMSCFASRLRTA
jgi:tetratricopeptide (TPR) repeat protein